MASKEMTPFQVKKQGLTARVTGKEFMDVLAANASRYIRPEKMAQMVITAADLNPAILDCTASSVLRSVLVAAAVGLEIGPALGHAYLVPYGAECVFVMGYRGAINLVTRGDKILNVTARAAFDCDKFDYELGTSERIYHKPELVRPEGTKLIATYAVATLANGLKPFHVSNREEIEDAKSRSKAKKPDSPWNSSFVAMARKTAVLRLAKYLPMNGDMANAMLAEDAAERGETQGREFLSHADDFEPAPTTAQAVRGRLDAIARPGAQTVDVDADDIPSELR